jgi:predicted DNA-binding transcriptional regulator AlpA
MIEPPAITPHRLLRTNEAAHWLGLSGRTLEKHRTFGTGPSYRKIGGRVVYALNDLQTWADRGARTSTTERMKVLVSPARRLEGSGAFAR